jgi:hypothetical protein
VRVSPCSLACVALLLACSSTESGASPADFDAPDETNVIGCPAPLSEHADFDAAPPPSWCDGGALTGGERSTQACDGFLARCGSESSSTP